MPTEDSPLSRFESELDAMIADFRADVPTARYVRDRRIWYEDHHPLSTAYIRYRLHQSQRARGIRRVGMVQDAELRLRALLGIDSEADLVEP